MLVFDRRQRRQLDQLVADAVAVPMPRRQFLYQAMALGLSLDAAAALLAGCEPEPAPPVATPPKVQSINVLNEWSGEEQESFQLITSAFTHKTGIKVNLETTRDLLAVLSTRLRGNNPPDISGIPSINHFRQLAAQNRLIRLDTFFDMKQYRQNYAQAWIDFSSYDGKLYAVLPKANAKDTIWYSPRAFHEIGVSVPHTWDEMIALSDQLVSKGKYPWSLGIESGATSGWPGADWIAAIYINKYGPDLYDQWVTHKIPWTHHSIKDAFEIFGRVALGKHYVNGGAALILSTNFQDASYLPFVKPPHAYMYYLGDFTAGFIKHQFKGIQSGQDYSFFPFPQIDPRYKNYAIASADLMAAFKDNNGTRQFMEFLTTVEAQSIWVRRGGATSVNSAVAKSVYPDEIAWACAQQILRSDTLRISADDLMPQELEDAFWKGVISYIGTPDQLDDILRKIEATALITDQS
ncbi:ABC transporter substrate-binding protein [Dictyobacter sp. S3.2.2.5]|uniref:ABC transporter substrate-binding protein n=1 Tax=Dictyobacter halimunensis TaxID=3026934 RepID=A0ABQ6G351_9CHLR|nr:ABC transporter substrate-binding protein [Dictyobacter sp. S3.2.2.5]